MNLSECTKIITILATNDVSGRVTEATPHAWHLVMADVPYDAAQAAAAEWLKHHKWFPMPAEFRDVLVSALTDLPDPDDAWSIVLDRMRSTYPGHPAPYWDAPAPVVRGLQAIGGMEMVRIYGNSPKVVQDFAEAYRRYRERDLHDFDIGDAWDRAIAAGRQISLPMPTRRPSIDA